MNKKLETVISKKKENKKSYFRFAEMYDPETGTWILVDALKLDASYRKRKFQCPYCHIKCYLKIYKDADNRFWAKEHKNCDSPERKKFKKPKYISVDGTKYFSKDEMFAAINKNGKHITKGTGGGGGGPIIPPGGETPKGPIEFITKKIKLHQLKSILRESIRNCVDIPNNSNDSSRYFLDDVITLEKKNKIVKELPDEFDGLMVLRKDTFVKKYLSTVKGKVWVKDYWSKDESDRMHILLSIPNNINASFELVSNISGVQGKNKDVIVFTYTKFKKIELVDGIVTYEAFVDDQGILFCISDFSDEEINDWLEKIDNHYIRRG